MTDATRDQLGDDRPGARDTAMTRSEEELRIDKVSRPSRAVRVRKYIVTEDVTVTVQVRREEIAIEPVETITASGPADVMPAVEQDGPLEIVLHREEYEVVKRVVPVERVRISKSAVVEERTVTDEIRKERIEVEGVETSER